MSGDEIIVLALVAGVPAVASLVGGQLALLHRPGTLIASIAFGLAGGALLGTVALEMLPHALDDSPLLWVVVAFATGFLAVYAFDLYMHRGIVAGEHAEQHKRVERAYRRKPPHGGPGAYLAAATSLEEIVEGLAIGVSLAVEPRLALLVGLAITIDNVSGGMAISELFRAEADGDARRARRPATLWTAVVGLALFVSAAASWFLLRDLPAEVTGGLVAAAAGAMLYLVLSDLLPEGQERQFQQSSVLAAGLAFAAILVLSTLGQNL
jgi:zinc transporter, ZIP family